MTGIVERMARARRIAPCPKCSNQHLGVYRYDNGGRHVECDKCRYLGPSAGSFKQAIEFHNSRALAAAIAAGVE
jgi:Zn ribbon nucleic-acid-binding protein